MKKITLTLGLALSILLLIDVLGEPKYCSFSCIQNYDGLAFNWLLIIGGSFLVACFLGFLSQRIFNSWWKFARVAIPIIFLLSTLINLQLHHRSGGFFNMDNMFDLPILISMYVIFILGSLIQIYRGYRNK